MRSISPSIVHWLCSNCGNPAQASVVPVGGSGGKSVTLQSCRAVLVVRVIDAASTHDLRNRVLRGGLGHDGFPEDAWPETLHLGAVDDDVIVGVATFVPRDDGWWQLRGMAVEPSRQGEGVGRAILADGDRHLRSVGASGVWANARDTALGFYERAGWVVVGDGYVLVDLPHHRVEHEL